MNSLTDAQRLVNRVRILMGKDPLYAPAAPPEPCGSYLSREVLCRLADPDCTRCGGSGYFDGWELDERCPCTGLRPKGKRGSGRHPHVWRMLFQPRRRSA